MRPCLLPLILACLLATLAPAHARSEGRLTACKATLKNLGIACEMWATDNKGSYPPSLSVLTPNYLKTIPTCPTARRDTYSSGYVRGTEPDRYAVWCDSDGHADANQPARFPAFTSTDGLLDPTGEKDLNACRRDVHQAQETLARYASAHGGRYPKTKPADFPPGLEYSVSKDLQKCQAYCPGAHHLLAGVQPFTPGITLVSGAPPQYEETTLPAPYHVIPPLLNADRELMVEIMIMVVLCAAFLWLLGRGIMHVAFNR
jgi:hypothetical protein